MIPSAADFLELWVEWEDRTPFGTTLSSRLQAFVRQSLYADTCQTLLQVRDRPAAGAVEPLSIRDLAQLVRGIVGYSGEIVWDSTRPDGTPRKWMDSSRIFQLGWRPQIDLETGIKLAYADFLKKSLAT